ncbi:hypothetical protein [Rhizorhabdus sp. FW153]|uniref:hypothetical protein n=1 Tax=Rhizorhabdus sp. FW153 TaxID=3400216 RepID=UPI003CFA1086
MELRTRKRKDGINTVLMNERGASWTASGFGGSGSFGMIRDRAKIAHTEEGEDGQRPKHLHDARGTFYTLLLTECELSDEGAARIMAWSPNRVARIRSTYVDTAAVVISLSERMRAKQSSGEARNGGKPVERVKGIEPSS